MLSMPFRLVISANSYDGMVAQARAELPNECCGLLAGVIEPGDPPLGRAVERYPLVNLLASPTAYESEPHSLLEAHKAMRRRGLEVLAIYHSHPASDPVPSKTDLARNYWPGALHLITSLKSEPAVVRGWWLTENAFEEADWIVSASSAP